MGGAKTPRERQEYWERLRHRVDRKLSEYDALDTALKEIEQDVTLIAERNVAIEFCVDFYDLFQYLTLQLPADWSPEQDDDVRILRTYTLLRLFREAPRKLVLLPWYFTEFQGHLDKEYRKRGLGTRGANREDFERFLAQLRIKLGNFVRTSIAPAAKQIPSDSTSLQRVRTEVQECLKQLRDFRRQLSARARIAMWVGRFNGLVEAEDNSGGLQGLKDVAKEGFYLTEDEIYQESIDFLRTLRNRPEPNVADAWCVSALNRLNVSFRSESRLFYLVSSSRTMRRLIQHLNRKLGPSPKLQVRDRFYWSVWFAFCVEDGGRKLPEIGRVRDLRNRLSPWIEELGKKGVLLRKVIKSGRTRLHRDPFPGLLKHEFDQAAVKVQRETAQMFGPLVQDKSRVGAVRDLLSVAEDHGIGEVLSKLAEAEKLLEKAANARRADVVQGVASEIQAAIRQLESILVRTQMVSEPRVELSPQVIESFGASDFDLHPHFFQCFIVLQMRGLQLEEEVFSAVNSLVETLSPSVERFGVELVMAEVMRLKEQPEKAVEFLDSVNERWKNNPLVRFERLRVQESRPSDLDEYVGSRASKASQCFFTALSGNIQTADRAEDLVRFLRGRRGDTEDVDIVLAIALLFAKQLGSGRSSSKEETEIFVAETLRQLLDRNQTRFIEPLKQVVLDEINRIAK